MQTAYILEENTKDVERAKDAGMKKSLIDRLLLTGQRIQAMAEGLEQIAKLEDPVGEMISMKVRPNGLQIGKKRVPLGVVGIIYESRPNVTADAFGLCFKTGNVVILRGGSDAISSNMAITKVIRDGLRKEGLPEDAVLYSMRGNQQGYMGVVKAVLWQILPVWIILRIPNLSMALSVEFTFLILLSIAICKGWFKVNKRRTLTALWSIVILLPVAAITAMARLGYVHSYQRARISAFIHPDGNDAGTFWGTIRSMIRGAHLAGRGEYENVWFFNRDYMLTFIIHYYGILAAVIVTGIVGGILLWFLKKTGKQKNQLGMIMGTGCITVLMIQFAGYVLENLGYFPLSNNYCMFLTTGGSGMMISYMMLGILLSIYRYQNVLAEPQTMGRRDKIQS